MAGPGHEDRGDAGVAGGGGQALTAHAGAAGPVAGEQQGGDLEGGHGLVPGDLGGDDAGQQQARVGALGGPYTREGLGVGHGLQGAADGGRQVGDLGGAGPLPGGAAGQELARAAGAEAGRVLQDDAAEQVGATDGGHHGGGRAHRVTDDDWGGRRRQAQGGPAARGGLQLLQDGDEVLHKDLPGPLELGRLPPRGQAVPAGVGRYDPVAAAHPVVDGLGQGDRGAGDAVEQNQGGGVVGPRDDARQ